MKYVEKQQFDNILRLLLVMGLGAGIGEHSPDYVVAKFNRFIGVDYDVYDTPQSGLHPTLEGLIPKYHKKWKTDWPIPRVGS